MKKESPQKLPLDSEKIIADYRLGYRSSQTSIIGRREVFTGKAKFDDDFHSPFANVFGT